MPVANQNVKSSLLWAGRGVERSRQRKGLRTRFRRVHDSLNRGNTTGGNSMGDFHYQLLSGEIAAKKKALKLRSFLNFLNK